MKTFIKTISIFAVVAVTGFNGSAQSYCTFTVDVANSFLAGITNVQLNSSPAINRTSTTTENNGFTNTGINVTVGKGQSYNFSVTANQDNMVCGSYNIKVYIDYNGDFDFVDAGEDAVTMNNVAAGVQTATFLVPATAATAQVRMRVALKMATGCGHTAVSPCNAPADPVGWHGEVEDYTLNVTSVIGIENYDAANHVKVYPNPVQSFLTVEIENYLFPKNAEFIVYDVLGKEVARTPVADGTRTFLFENKNLLNGVYSCKLFSEGMVVGTGKFVVGK